MIKNKRPETSFNLSSAQVDMYSTPVKKKSSTTLMSEQKSILRRSLDKTQMSTTVNS